MTDDPHRPAPTGIVLDELLLDAKVSVPRPRSAVVSRAALIEAARASGCRVVGVTAPAGYGKSTLLVEWRRARRHQHHRRVSALQTLLGLLDPVRSDFAIVTP